MFIQPISRLDSAYVLEICYLIPMRKTPAEQRREPNRYIRERLPNISNLAVAHLALIVGHQLSLKELRRRADERNFSLCELFCLGEMLCAQTHYRRARNRLVQSFLLPEIGRLAPTVSAEQALAVISAYRRSRLQHDYRVINLILERRADGRKLCSELG